MCGCQCSYLWILKQYSEIEVETIGGRHGDAVSDRSDFVQSQRAFRAPDFTEVEIIDIRRTQVQQLRAVSCGQ